MSSTTSKQKLSPTLYTHTGDAGTTSLAVGGKVAKTDPRIVAVGDVDELSSHIGLLAAQLPQDERAVLRQFQRRLFAIGARLSGIDTPTYFPIGAEVENLERAIDSFGVTLGGFVLPGGTPTAAQAHVCRAVCRRAERSVVATGCTEALPWLNRLSDWFFAYAHRLNREAGESEELL